MTGEPRRGMRLLAWKPLHKNSLRGFATIELPNGLVINEVPVLTSHGRCWAALPSKPQTNPDGTPRLVGGKPGYTPILQWNSRELQDRFSDALVALVEAAHGPLEP